jgi:hypothetical protein
MSTQRPRRALTPPYIRIYDGQRRCLGHILLLGDGGIEALDADERSLGLFDNQEQAEAAIMEFSAPAA